MAPSKRLPGPPPIRYHRSREPSTLVLVPLEQAIDGTVRKTKVPQISGGDAESTLSALRAFRKACTLLTWTSGPELFHGINQVLVGTARDDWDTNLVDEGLADVNNATVDDFDAVLQRFKRSFLSTQARRNQYDYIRQLEFERSETKTVRTFHNRMRYLCLLLTEIPGPAQFTIDVEQRKRIFLRSMPATAQDTFHRNNMSLAEFNEPDLVDYMEHLLSMAPSRKSSSAAATDDSDDSTAATDSDLNTATDGEEERIIESDASSVSTTGAASSQASNDASSLETFSSSVSASATDTDDFSCLDAYPSSTEDSDDTSSGDSSDTSSKDSALTIPPPRFR